MDAKDVPITTTRGYVLPPAGIPTAHDLELVELILRPFRAVKRAVKKVLPKPKPPPPPVTVMFDSVNLTQFPPNPPAVAGYTSGYWPTYKALVAQFPKAKHLSIAINASEDADCLDVETGDATPAEAPTWVRRQQKRGLKRPVVYANLSTMPQVVAALVAAGIRRVEVRLIVAHYTYVAHIEPGYDGCQWTDKAFGHNLDQTQLLPSFWT